MLFYNDLFKTIRLAKGMTLEEVGKGIGISKQTVAKWEKGQVIPRPANVHAIARLFGVSVIDISDLKPEKELLEQLNQDHTAKIPDTIMNTPELRLCIKEAMIERGLKTAADLKRLIGYDSVHTLERLLAGKLNWFPDVLSAVLESLGISHDDAPVTPAERHLLLPEGLFTQGGILIRPIPIVDWANAASFIESTIGGDGLINEKWDIENTEMIPAPVGMRKGTVAVRVRGASMEPRILDGDALYCSPVDDFNEIRNKRVVLVRFADHYRKCPDCLVVKRIYRVGDTFSLLSDNSNDNCQNFENLSLNDIAWIRSVEGKFSTDL